MERLQDFNGQQAIIDAVSARRDKPQKEVIVAAGAPGTGITWTLERAAEAWAASGGAALQAKGEPFATERKLFPWLTMALPGAKHLARLAILKTTVAQGSRAVPVLGSVASYLVDELLNYRKKRLAREAVVLTEQEQDLLFVIQNAAHNKRLLLTLDRLDVWDEASWALLALILSPRLHELYPVLTDALILVGSRCEIPCRLRELDTRLSITEFAVRPLGLNEMRLALATFDIPITAREEVDRLYSVTDGRLDLLHDLGTHVREPGFSELSGSLGALYDDMIERRIRSITQETGELRQLLSAAAILGQSFAVEDIQCLTGYAPGRLNTNLHLALAEHLLSGVGEIARFQSAALHRHFHLAGVGEHTRYHSKFADCLQTMRPGDYAYRLHHLLAAGRADEALVCYALATLAAKRNHGQGPGPAELKNASGWIEVSKYLDAMHAAYSAYADLRVSDSMQVLDSVEGFLPGPLIAERDYLEAQILLKSPRIINYKRAVELLDRWRGLKDSEGEVWARIAQVLIVAKVQTGCIDEARSLEAEVTAQYWSRRKVDPWALFGLNALRRRAECLHHLPAATLRLESAATYFGPQESQAAPRHPVEYYYSLTNLVGNLLASGRFDEAYVRALELDGLVRDYPLFGWPVLEIPINNFILAAYLTRRIEAETAVRQMERLLKEGAETGDRILMASNHAVYLVRSGRQSEALAALEHTYAEVMAGSEPDSYHQYFVGNNLAALRALVGEYQTAKHLYQECGAVLERFYPAVQQTLRRRHELLAPAIVEAEALGPVRFDSFLGDHHTAQLGPQWAFYGRGFLLSDIQFWSAD